MDVSTFTSHRRTLSTAAGEIAYTEWGTGPAAVFVHGVFTSGALWRHVIERLDDTTRCIAIDLPGHGGTPPRADQSVTAMTAMVVDLCEGLGLDQVDLVGNDTGGAIAQLVATRHSHLLRSLTLTNCDTEGNFPPEGFAPIVALAAQGQVAALLPPLAADPEAARTSMLAGSFEHPDKTPDDMWREYLVPVAGDIERARSFERLIAAIDPVQMKGVNDLLRGLDVPTLLVWGTAEAMIGMEWAYRLRDLIPQVSEVVEVPGAKLFFPEERPEELAIPLRRFWGR
jgi:pimeloyl-ACP methyl ester carboxylesterase